MTKMPKTINTKKRLIELTAKEHWNFALSEERDDNFIMWHKGNHNGLLLAIDILNGVKNGTAISNALEQLNKTKVKPSHPRDPKDCEGCG